MFQSASNHCCLRAHHAAAGQVGPSARAAPRLACCGDSGTLLLDAELHINKISLACREVRVKLCAGQSPRYRHVKNQFHRRRPSATRRPKATAPSASPGHNFSPLKVHFSVSWPSYLDGSCMCGQTEWAGLLRPQTTQAHHATCAHHTHENVCHIETHKSRVLMNSSPIYQ
jgi:hypothetical protein